MKRSPQEHCWEAPDGQVHCGWVKRDPQEHCWEAPDGQIHCSYGKREALPGRFHHHVDFVLCQEIGADTRIRAEEEEAKEES